MKIMSNPPAYLRREDYNFFVLFGKFYVLYKTTQKEKKENNNLTELGNQEQINYKY